LDHRQTETLLPRLISARNSVGMLTTARQQSAAQFRDPHGSRKDNFIPLFAGAGSVGHGRASCIGSGARERASESAGFGLAGPVEGAFRLALSAFFNEGRGDFLSVDGTGDVDVRSEERRVGKEGRCRWSL